MYIKTWLKKLKKLTLNTDILDGLDKLTEEEQSDFRFLVGDIENGLGDLKTILEKNNIKGNKL